MLGNLVKIAAGVKIKRFIGDDLSLIDMKRMPEDSIGLVLEVEDTYFSNKFYRVLLPNEHAVWVLGTDIDTIQA